MSPSFNWTAHGYTDEQLKSFVWDLGKAGFLIQLISLAGLHSTAVVTGKCRTSPGCLGKCRTDLSCSPTAELAKRFKTDGMLAYVELIQKKEKEIGCDVFTHQKWSGASYSDRVLNGASHTHTLGLWRTDAQRLTRCTDHSRRCWVVCDCRRRQGLDRAHFLDAF